MARNALARSAGKDGAAIKALTKPPLAAWAVNQLFWQDRDHYDALIEAANEMRRTHKAVIEGKRGDLRTAGREHDAALDAALKSSLALVKDAGNPVTEATRQAILNTLRALPANEPPGRLTRALAPGGFEMLAGVEPVPASRRTVKSPQPATRPGSAPKGATRKEDARAEREAAKAREQKMRAGTSGSRRRPARAAGRVRGGAPGPRSHQDHAAAGRGPEGAGGSKRGAGNCETRRRTRRKGHRSRRPAIA